MTRRCCDCRWFSNDFDSACLSPRVLESATALIRDWPVAAVARSDAWTVRTGVGLCGPEGTWFEEKVNVEALDRGVVEAVD